MGNKKDIFFMGHAHVSLITLLLCAAILILSLLVFWLPEADQPALTAPLVCLSVFFTFFWCIPLARNRMDGKMDWFHPAILLMMIYFAYFIFSGVWLWLYHDYDSIWVNLGNRPASVVNFVFTLGVVSIFSFGLGMRTKFPFPRKFIPELPGYKEPFRRREMRYLILFFLVIGITFKFYHLSLFGPLSTDIFRYLSPSANRALGLNISQFVIMLESMLDWAALLTIFYYIMRYKEIGRTNGWWPVILVLIMTALFDYVVSAKRSGVIPLFLLPLIWYHYIIRRLSLVRAGMLFLVGMLAIVGLLMARIVLPLLAQGLTPNDYIGESTSETLAFYIDTGEWSTFDLIAASVVQREDLLTRAGGTIAGFLKYSFSTLIIFIPRAIWPAKPSYEDLSHVYYRVLIGSNEGIGFAPTIWGASFLLFHVVGLVVGMYILGWLLKSVYEILELQKGGPFHIFLYSVFYWMTFQFLRNGTTGFVIILFVQSMFVGVFAMFLLWHKRKSTDLKFT